MTTAAARTAAEAIVLATIDVINDRYHLLGRCSIVELPDRDWTDRATRIGYVHRVLADGFTPEILTDTAKATIEELLI